MTGEKYISGLRWPFITEMPIQVSTVGNLRISSDTGNIISITNHETSYEL